MKTFKSWLIETGQLVDEVEKPWIQQAVKHPGALKKALGKEENEPLTDGDITRALKSGDAELFHMATAAINMNPGKWLGAEKELKKGGHDIE